MIDSRLYIGGPGLDQDHSLWIMYVKLDTDEHRK